MGLFGSMTSSVSALAGQGEAISVISDNLANINTVGYKANRTLFSQLVTSSGSGGQFNSGGVGTNVQRGQTEQGAFLATQSALDLGLSGNGFFVVHDNTLGDTSTSVFYTRAGSFLENADGFLTTPDGLFLQGWQTDSDGTILNVQNPTSVSLDSVGASARATSNFTLKANLNSTTSAHSFDTTSARSNDLSAIVSDPSTADYITDARFFDAQGNPRDVTYGFVKRAANLWDWVAYTDGANITGGTAGANTQIGTGSLRFNEDGTLRESSGATISANWSGGVAAGSITLDFGNATGGKVATPTAAGGLEYTDHILDISIDDNTFANDTYTVRYSGDDTLELLDSGSNVVGTATMGDAATTRIVEFSNGGNEIGVRMTVGGNFTDGSGGVYPFSVGTFDVTTLAATGTGSGSEGVVQFSAANNTVLTDQNGFGAGTISSVSVDKEGFVIGSFTNGETKKLYKLTIAVFPNPSGLETESGTLLKESSSSGGVLLKEAGVAGTADVVSGSLEQSTVDIAGEFSQMIVTQRAYQAGSTVITTVDQMLNELMQIR